MIPDVWTTLPQKPMEYASHKFDVPIVLAQGDYYGFHFLVVNMGPHPNAYIQIPNYHPLYRVDYQSANDLDLPYFPNWGFTFADFLNTKQRPMSEEVPSGWYLGWDYAHAGDYNGVFERKEFSQINTFGRKYATREILEEVKRVIDGLIGAKYEQPSTNETSQAY